MLVAFLFAENKRCFTSIWYQSVGEFEETEKSEGVKEEQHKDIKLLTLYKREIF